MRAVHIDWLFRLFLTSLLLGLTLAVSTLASGAGVVGTGTPASCTEAAFAAALQGGGAVTFACGPEPVEIAVTHRHEPTIDTEIDGGGLVTLSAGRRSGVLGVQGNASMTVRGLTIADSSDLGALRAGSGTVLLVEDVHFVDNQKSGISNGGGEVEVRRGSFRNNLGSGAGGIYHASGTLDVVGSEFVGNDGGIWAEGPATVRAALFENNRNTFDGGGAIWSSKALTVTDSVFRGNTGTDGGGAILCWRELVVERSSFVDNRALKEWGGAVRCWNDVRTPGSRVEIRDSVFSGNGAPQAGGAVYVAGPETAVVLENLTVTGNEAPRGSGIFYQAKTGAVRNLTFAGDDLEGNAGGLTVTNTLFVEARCAGAIGNGGGNLQFPPDVCRDILPNAAQDPALGALADNGGPTLTRALPVASSARGAGTAACPAADQRGARRPAGEPCDAGAYEYGAVPVLTSLSPARVPVGSPELLLLVRGSGFVRGAYVRFDGEDLPTEIAGSTELWAIVSAARLAREAIFSVTVRTSVPDGGESEPIPFTVSDGSGEEPFCGDGNRDEGEVCDDGNTVSGDGCEADCTPTEPDPGECDELADIARVRCELALAKQPGWACEEPLTAKLVRALAKSVDAADAKLAKAVAKPPKRPKLVAAAARKIEKLEAKATGKLGAPLSDACRAALGSGLEGLEEAVLDLR